MKDIAILPRKYRRQAKRDQKAIESAMIAGTSITAAGMRRMARIGWEADRSPSRLGRAGERAGQINEFITPVAASATVIIALVGSTFDLYAKYRVWRDRPVAVIEKGDSVPAE